MSIELAIQAVGSPSELAKRSQTTPQNISNMRARNRVPSGWVIPVSKATGWAVTPHQIRPDLYPNPTDGLPTP
ncbi:MAG: YdaS family helix-turn-helix protein [Candidatus Thiodiazotropha endolucinida]